MAGLYIHIPFCKQACHYCDFHFSTNLQRKHELIQALCQEMVLQQSYLGIKELHTVYFGGGTPSILSSEEFSLLLETIRHNFTIIPHAEITVEANPDDLSPEKLRLLQQAGVNRLSIGIQTFDDDILRFLNRAHDGNMAETCVQGARSAGFTNLNVDIIYAIPGQSVAMLEESLDRTLSLNPEHISAYALTIEEKTVFGNWAAKGKITPLADDETAFRMEWLIKKLSDAGYEHYEVSNFCKPGLYSRHNSSYWNGEPYLGIGPGAHSYNGASRQYNVSNNHHYLRALQQNIIPCEIETLTATDIINEYLLISLRTSRGCNLAKLKNDMQFDLLQRHGRYLEDLFDKKLAVLEKDTLKLTSRGLLLADQIVADLFQEKAHDA